MAVLTPEELAEIRRRIEADIPNLGTKPILNQLAQALDNWFDGEKAGLSNGFDQITDPVVLSNSTKKKIFAYWLLYRFGKEVT